MSGGSLIRLAACPVQDAKATCRLVTGRLVDDAGGLAIRGAKPNVRAYPGQQGLNVAAALATYAQSPDTSPDVAAFYSRFLPVVDAGMVALVRRGEVPCLVVGTYDVDAPPDDNDRNRPAQFFGRDGQLISELYPGGAP